MTHPLQLTDTPVFASLLNDPRFAELTMELQLQQECPFDDRYQDIHLVLHSDSTLSYLGHPENCLACSTFQFEFSMLNPTPPINRGLELCASPTKPARTTKRTARSRKAQ